MARPRVLVLTPTFPPTFGGIQLATHRVVASWRRLDARVVTLASPGSDAFDERQTFPVERVSRPASSQRMSIAALNLAALVAALRWRPHVLLSCHITTAPAARLAAALLRVPYVQWVHAKEVPSRPRLARFAVQGAVTTIAVSRHSADLLRAVGATDAPIEIVPHGVDPPAERSSAPHQRATRPTILFVGRLRDRHKGLDVVIRSMPDITARVPGSVLVVVGDGPLRAEYERMADEAGVDDAVVFEGAVADEERDRWLDLAHVFAMPGRQAPDSGGEGFGIVYLEASAHGLPIVAGDAGGSVDAVEHGVTGLLVDANDERQVAGAIVSILGDPALARRLGEGGRQRAARSTWARASGRIERILLDAVAQQAAQRAGRHGRGAPRRPRGSTHQWAGGRHHGFGDRPGRQRAAAPGTAREVVLDPALLDGRRVPDLFIVGAPRSGTTSLYGYLAQHPDIFLPDLKEPHFLASDLDSGSYQDSLYFVRDLGVYLSLFEPAGPDRLTGEGSTSYLQSAVAARNIRRLNPAARIIVMLRDPVEMLRSFHQRRLFSGAEDIERFDEALAAEDDRRRGQRIPAHARNIPALFYRDVARFGDQVGRYLEVFPREQILFVVFDDLRADPLDTYRSAARFLGVDPAFEPAIGIEYASRTVHSRRLQHLLLSPTLIRVGRAVLPVSAHRRIRPIIDLLNTRKEPPRALDPGLQARLRDDFRPDVERLSDLVGRDLVRLWSYHRPAPARSRAAAPGSADGTA